MTKYHSSPLLAEVSRSDGGGYCRDCYPNSLKRMKLNAGNNKTSTVAPASGGHAKTVTKSGMTK